MAGHGFHGGQNLQGTRFAVWGTDLFLIWFLY